MLNTEVSTNDSKVFPPHPWGQMADGPGLIYFGDLNIQVIYIAFKKIDGRSPRHRDDLLPMDHCLSQLG